MNSSSIMQRRKFLKALTKCAGVLALEPFAVEAKLPGGSPTSASNSAAKESGIYLNQIGFLPQSRKVASVTSAARSFQIRRLPNQAIVFEGALATPHLDEASGDSVRTADFSKLQTPGRYAIHVDGDTTGPEFTVGSDIYLHPLWLTMRAFYGQRCGCDVDLGNGYAHPKCHMEGAYHPTSGRSGKIANHGGWHDAGDYGRYIVNSGISTGTLLWTWEFYGPSLRSLDLNIPESGGKTPDFLAEIQWNLNWMLELQDADGGVWQKQTSEQFCPFIMPQDDHSVSYVIGTGAPPYQSTCATADLAAVMAIAARCYSQYHPAFAQRCLEAAKKAWAWSQQHPDVPFKNPAGIGTGEYSDRNCLDEISWAAAELWRTTGEEEFQRAFLSSLPRAPETLAIKAPSWNNLTAMACWTYALAERKSSPQAVAEIREASLKTARELAQRSLANGYGNTMALNDYIWGSNGVAANHALLLIVAKHFETDRSFTNAAVANLDYLFGRNCFGLSWVTQLGSHPFMHPHHRPSVADGIVAPWPGLMSGGPNGHPGDAVARLLPMQPPMRMYVDDQRAYSCNEVAINWNAPLVFALAAADASGRSHLPVG